MTRIQIAIGMLPFLVIVAAAALIIRHLRRLQPVTGSLPARTAREILDERYARGELSRQAYEQMRSDIEC